MIKKLIATGVALLVMFFLAPEGVLIGGAILLYVWTGKKS